MNTEVLSTLKLPGFLQKPDLLVLSGSHLYGIANENSDNDWRGFVLPPATMLLGLEHTKFNQYCPAETDTVIYSLERFIKHALGGNTNVLECLFANEFVSLSTVGRIIVDNRSLFLSKKIYRCFRGFAQAEMRRCKATSLTIRCETESQQETLERLVSIFNLKRHERDVIVDLIEESTGKPIRFETVSTRKLGDKRKGLVAQWGYDCKAFSNVIRILSQGVELLTNDQLTFPRPEAELLRSIRKGEFPITDIDRMYKERCAALDMAYAATSLPTVPPIDEINRIYVDIVRNHGLCRI